MTDDTIVSLPIDLIRSANIKMIERNYLIKVNNEKDSIIYYLRNANSILNDDSNSFRNMLLVERQNNTVLQEEIKKQKNKTNKAVKYSLIGSVVILAIGFIIK